MVYLLFFFHSYYPSPTIYSLRYYDLLLFNGLCPDEEASGEGVGACNLIFGAVTLLREADAPTEQWHPWPFLPVHPRPPHLVLPLSSPSTLTLLFCLHSSELTPQPKQNQSLASASLSQLSTGTPATRIGIDVNGRNSISFLNENGVDAADEGGVEADQFEEEEEAGEGSEENSEDRTARRISNGDGDDERGASPDDDEEEERGNE